MYGSAVEASLFDRRDLGSVYLLPVAVEVYLLRCASPYAMRNRNSFPNCPDK